MRRTATDFSRTRRRAIAVAPAFAVLAAVLGSEQSRAANYSFANIASSAEGYSGVLSQPAINNRGEVAFGGFDGAPSGAFGIYRYSNGTVTPLYTGFDLIGDPVINNEGTVAFRALDGPCCPFDETIYRGDGGPLTRIADNAGEFHQFSNLAMNDSGTVAFHGYYFDHAVEGSYFGDGGPLATVADTTQRYDRFWGAPTIDAAGNVYSNVRLDFGGEEIISGNGASTTRLYTGAGFLSPGSSAAGMLAFTEFLGSCCERGQLVTGNGGPLTVVANTDGPFRFFGEGAMINAAGTVAFQAFLDAGGVGIYTGPDPLADKVIATGDPLFGSTVRDVGFHRALNDAGQIAFYYLLDSDVIGHDVYGVAVATPITDLPGDYSGNGLVEQADLDLVLTNWGADATVPPAGWTNDLPSGFVDQGELDGVLVNWGNSATGGTNLSAGIPEPGGAMLLLLAGCSTLVRRRRSCRTDHSSLHDLRRTL